MCANPHKRRRSAFTLIEMMVVMAIMVIIMAAGIGGFKGFEKRSKLDAAAARFRNDLSLARQMAMMKNVTVVMAVPYPNAMTRWDPKHVDKCLRSYAFYDKTNQKYLTGWNYLPDGVVFVDTYSPDIITPPSGIGTVDMVFTASIPGQEPMLFPSDDPAESKTANFKRLFFTPDGSTLLGGGKQGYFFRLAEGTVAWPSTGMQPNDTDPAQYRLSTNDAQTVDVIVYHRSGRIEVVKNG